MALVERNKFGVKKSFAIFYSLSQQVKFLPRNFYLGFRLLVKVYTRKDFRNFKKVCTQKNFFKILIWDLSMLCLTPYLNIKFSWHFEIRADCAYELFSPRHSHKIDLVNFIFLLAKNCSREVLYSWNCLTIKEFCA